MVLKAPLMWSFVVFEEAKIINKEVSSMDIDWNEVLKQWCESKLSEPSLTSSAFAERIGRKANTIRSRCNNQIVKLYTQQLAKIEAGELSNDDALTALELWQGTKEVKPTIPASRSTKGNQKARKSGVWSPYIHEDDLSIAMKSLSGDVNYQDEVLVRAKLAGVVRSGNSIDNFEAKVLKRIEENDGIVTDLDQDDMASIRKNRSNNLRDFDMLMGRLDNVRTSRKREENIDADTRVKRLSGDKVGAESGGNEELDIEALLAKAKRNNKDK